MAEPLDFSVVTLDQLKKMVEEEAGKNPDLAVNRAFIEGDHWQGGDGWVGPRPPAGDAGAAEMMAAIERGFVSKNVIYEVTHRHVSGVLGREPGWTLVPRRQIPDGEELTPEEVLAIEEANTLLVQWWDARDGHGVLWDVIERVLYSKRSMLRLMVPAGAVQGSDPAQPTVAITAATPFDAIMLIYPDTPLPEQAFVRVDPDTKEKVAILVQERENKASAEVAYLDRAQMQPVASGGVEGADLTRPSAVPMTVIRSMSEEQGEAIVPLPLGGRLTMMEVVRQPLISPQVRQAQRALNLALSMVPRNVVTGGFLERIITNSIMPGETKKNTETGVTEFIPRPHAVGAGVTTYLEGIEVEDEISGKRTMATPGVHWREPIPVTSSVDAKKSHYEDILDECDQRHVLMSSDATASGVSREQGRADFEESLRVTAGLVTPLGRWLLETLLAITEAALGTPGRWTDVLRAEFRVYVNTGPLSAEETRINNESVAAGTMSLESAMQRAGIADIDAEMTRILEQDDARLAIIERQVNIIKILYDAGMTLEDAGRAVGVSDEVLAELRKAVSTEPNPDEAEAAGAPVIDDEEPTE